MAGTDETDTRGVPDSGRAPDADRVTGAGGVPSTDRAPEAADRTARENRWSLAAAVALSLATLVSAWCGFQASVWGSEYSHASRTATAARMEASRHAAVADRQLSSDVLLFSTWLQAAVTGEEVVAEKVADRFQPHFRPAFDDWLAGPVPEGQLVPAGTPFERSDYVLPTQADADAANARADTAILAADTAGEHSTRYVLATVLFASVLFLAGIAAKLSNPRAAHAVVVLAVATLALALVNVLILPMHLSLP